MCQISVVLEQDGKRKKIMDSVTQLEVKGNGVILNTFFEEPLEVSGVVISSIDFLGGAVVLSPSKEITGNGEYGGNRMNDIDKLRVMLPHWIEHNSGHGHEFSKWAELLEKAGRYDIAALLKKAESYLMEADTVLKEALQVSGGSLEGHADHHHHHNLPE